MCKFKYKFQQLLSLKDSNTITGPMGPMMFAKQMIKSIGLADFNVLSRVVFEDQEVFQIYEGKGKTELTGHDILIIGKRYENTSYLTLWVDEGVQGLPVANYFYDDDKVTLSPLYRREVARYKKNLSKLDLHYLFRHAVASENVVGQLTLNN